MSKGARIDHLVKRGSGGAPLKRSAQRSARRAPNESQGRVITRSTGGKKEEKKNTRHSASFVFGYFFAYLHIVEIERWMNRTGDHPLEMHIHHELVLLDFQEECSQRFQLMFAGFRVFWVLQRHPRRTIRGGSRRWNSAGACRWQRRGFFARACTRAISGSPDLNFWALRLISRTREKWIGLVWGFEAPRLIGLVVGS